MRNFGKVVLAAVLAAVFGVGVALAQSAPPPPSVAPNSHAWGAASEVYTGSSGGTMGNMASVAGASATQRATANVVAGHNGAIESTSAKGTGGTVAVNGFALSNGDSSAAAGASHQSPNGNGYVVTGNSGESTSGMSTLGVTTQEVGTGQVASAHLGHNHVSVGATSGGYGVSTNFGFPGVSSTNYGSGDYTAGQIGQGMLYVGGGQ